MAFSLPLATFLSSSGYRCEDRVYHSYTYRMHYFTRTVNEWQGVKGGQSGIEEAERVVKMEEREVLVWGMTAHVLIAAAKVAFAQEPDFPQLAYQKVMTSMEGSSSPSQSNL